jgi:putative phosphoesterase
VLVALGDSHRVEDAGLQGRTAEAVAAAETVCHTGDFTTTAVHEALADRAGDATMHAVHGNSDVLALRERLPAVGTVEAVDRRIVLVHGHQHDRTSLSLLARQENADCVVVGHSHRPGIEELGAVTLVNPGSYADPRGAPATHAEVGRTSAGVTATIVTVGGEELTAGRV